MTLILLVVASCVGCDQASKTHVEARLANAGTLSFLADSVRLQLAHNEGAFLSAGSSLSKPVRQAVFRTGVGCFLLALLVYAVVLAPPRPWLIFGLSLVFAGGASNLIDRFVHDGQVVDFLNIGIGTLRTGIFNIADVCITAGVLIILVAELRARRNGPQRGP